MGKALVLQASLRLADQQSPRAKLPQMQLLVGLGVAMTQQVRTQMVQEPWTQQGYQQKPQEQPAMWQTRLVQSARSASGCWNMCDCPNMPNFFLCSTIQLATSFANAQVLFPAMRQFYKPPRSRATDGTVVELTRLEKLYKIFERC